MVTETELHKRIVYLESIIRQHNIPVIAIKDKLAYYATPEMMKPSKHDTEIAKISGRSFTMERLIPLLKVMPLDKFMAAKMCHCHERTAYVCLKKLHTMKKAFISGWARTDARSIPIYSWGKGQDVPKLLTKDELSKKGERVTTSKSKKIQLRKHKYNFWLNEVNELRSKQA